MSIIQHYSLSKLVVTLGAIWIILYTLNPPRCSVDLQGQVNRESSAFIFSGMFHHVERPMPADGSSRQFIDKNGKSWNTTSKYDAVQLDWTRYMLGLILLLVGTTSLAFILSAPPSALIKNKPNKSQHPTVSS